MRRAACSMVSALATLSAFAAAHESRPLFIEVAENEGVVSVRSVAPASIDGWNAPRVSLSAPCEKISERGSGVRRLEATYRCPENSGAALRIEWPEFNPSVTTIVRARLVGDETRTAVLEPGATTWRIPAAEAADGLASGYFRIGVEHIAFGVDHLLFLAGLLVIAGTFRRAIVTATGFTLAHSLTLALVTLGVVAVPIPAVEAAIALSIVFLAAEIARANRATLAWRRPALVASAFGLVHGAGFAAALAEIGLPPGEKIAALFFFNLGVEAGQVALILSVFGVIAAAGRLRRLPPEAAMGRAAVAFSYALGLVSAFWFMERTSAILFG